VDASLDVPGALRIARRLGISIPGGSAGDGVERGAVMTKLPAYVVVTPARNEERSIEMTIRSMIAQTAPPLRWVIVSDGSTDGTDDIVKKYSATHPWIELVRMPQREERHFAGKVYAFNAGRARVQELPYEVIASLDADITFEPDYFAFLLEKLERRSARHRTTPMTTAL
jgi:glycosyltransferase involved in cell wall biosynthesis